MRSCAHYLEDELYELSRKDSSVFDFLQDGALDGIWYWDLEKPENEWMSARFWTTLGYDPAEKKHLASEWQDLVHPADLKAALENYHVHCADPDHPYDQVVRYRHRDGSTVWIRCRGMAIRDETGKPVRMLGSHTDLTPQKKAEEALRHSERLFGTMFDSIQDGICVLDENLTIVRVNRALADMYDPGSSFVGKKCHEVFQRRSEVCEGCPARQAMISGKHETREVEFVSEGNLKGLLEVHAFPMLDDSGVPTMVVEYIQDITSKKGAENALRKSEEKYSNLFHRSNDAVILHDLEGRILEANRKALELFGYEEKEIRDVSISRLHTDETHPQMMKNLETVIREGSIQAETRLVKKGGDVIHARISASLLQLEDEKVVQALVQDITDQKEAELALRESEQRFRQLFEQADEAIIVHDMEGFILAVNSKACANLGYGKEEMLGMSIGDFDPKAFSHGVEKRAWHTLPVTFESVHQRKDGSLFPVEIRLSGITFHEQDLVLSMSSDITERKRAEQELADSKQRLADIIDFLPYPTWVIDRQGRVITWNRAIEKLTGIDKKEILGKNGHAHAVPFYGKARPMLIDLVLRRDSSWEEAYEGLREEDGMLSSMETFSSSMGKGDMYLSGSAGRLFDTKGNIVGAIESVRDITVRKHAEQEREELIIELKNALSKVRKLSGLLPICSCCKKVRDDKGYWNQIESFISKHSMAEFSHSICPECFRKLYPELDALKE